MELGQMNTFINFFQKAAEDTSYAAIYESSSWAIILQALYDLVPITLFLVGAIILQRCLYNKMVKGNYALFAAGSIMVFAAGFLKAMHKLIIGITGYTYTILDKQFTSTQSIGFALMFIALVGMFTKYNKKYTKVQVIGTFPFIATAILASTDGLPEYNNTMPFIVMMIIGAAGSLVMLVIISIRRKDILSAIFFGTAIIFMVGMGYLSTKASFKANWIAISVNIVYQALFMLGTIRLQKRGFMAEDALATVAE